MNFDEVLFDIGTVVDAETENKGEYKKYLIIGKRAYNPNTGNSWDYVSVPYEEGFKINNKADHPYEFNNLYFLNHTDIRERIDTYQIR